MAHLWDQLVCAVCRPPRDKYSERDLIGGERATFQLLTEAGRRKFYRQDVQIQNSRGQTLQCSHYRPCIVTSCDGRLPCVIYCHSNAGSRRDAEEIVFNMLPKGITVFALDFAGSGMSDGEWVTLGAHEVKDLAAVVEYLRSEGSTSMIALWGRSMGAVTAIMYSSKDPTIAAVVADSPFSKLTDLMMELATSSGEEGLNIPKPLVKVALNMMRRSVRRKAQFIIDDVSPLDIAPSCFVPCLFGHGISDTFVLPHHSERLFVNLGSETKNYVPFDGDHNGVRPEFFYDSALIFLVNALHVDEQVGPCIDLRMIDPNSAPHLTPAAPESSIYVVRTASNRANENQSNGNDTLEQIESDTSSEGLETEGRTTERAAQHQIGGEDFKPFSRSYNSKQFDMLQTNMDAQQRRDAGKFWEDPDEFFNDEESEEEAMLQKALELSLADMSSANVVLNIKDGEEVHSGETNGLNRKPSKSGRETQVDEDSVSCHHTCPLGDSIGDEVTQDALKEDKKAGDEEKRI